MSGITLCGIELGGVESLYAQEAFQTPFQESTEELAPGSEVILKSLLLPGWGHHAVNPQEWRRGQVHMALDVTMALGLVRSVLQENRFISQYETLARLKAGVSLDGKSRSFALAVADYNSLQEYNEQMLRSRQWNRLFDDTPDNQWDWLDESDRKAYSDLRSDADRAGRQIPALISFMVANRIISSFSAYNRSRKARTESESMTSNLAGPSGSRFDLRVDPVWNTLSGRVSPDTFPEMTSNGGIPSISGAQATFRIHF